MRLLLALFASIAFTVSTAQAQKSSSEIADLMVKSILEKDSALLDEVLSSDELDLNELLGGQYTALHLASNQGNLDAVIKLISSGADLDAREPENGWTPLMIAVYAGQETVAKALVLAGANIEIVGTDQSTARVLAKYSGMAALLPDLPQAEPKLDQAELDAFLIDASEANDLDLARQLLKQGAEISSNSGGWTPLHYAAYWHNLDLYALLRKANGSRSVEQQDRSSEVSLAQAVIVGAASVPGEIRAIEMLNYLKRIGVSIEATGGSDVSNWLFAYEADLSSAILAMFEPDSTDVARAAQPEGDWFVIAGSYPNGETLDARQRLSALKSANLDNAEIIDTNNFSNLRDGLLAVVLRFESKDQAFKGLLAVRQIVSDAYVKKGN